MKARFSLISPRCLVKTPVNYAAERVIHPRWSRVNHLPSICLARAGKERTALLAALSLRLYIQRFLTSSDSREPSPDTITGILAPESHPQSLRDLSALHVYRDLHSDLVSGKALTLRLTGSFQAHSNRIYYFGPLLARFRVRVQVLLRRLRSVLEGFPRNSLMNVPRTYPGGETFVRLLRICPAAPKNSI